MEINMKPFQEYLSELGMSLASIQGYSDIVKRALVAMPELTIDSLLNVDKSLAYSNHMRIKFRAAWNNFANYAAKNDRILPRFTQLASESNLAKKDIGLAQSTLNFPTELAVALKYIFDDMKVSYQQLQSMTWAHFYPNETGNLVAQMFMGTKQTGWSSPIPKAHFDILDRLALYHWSVPRNNPKIKGCLVIPAAPKNNAKMKIKDLKYLIEVASTHEPSYSIDIR